MKIQLIHPEGKKAVAIDSVKYNQMKDAIVATLSKGDKFTHTDLLNGIREYFTLHDIKFEGSVNWHFEWVKLDLEARKVIGRINSNPILLHLLDS